MIKNFLDTQKRIQNASHGGSGSVDLYEIWGKSDFESNVDFIDRVVIPPNSTIGYHKHGNNEEMYVVLAGEGTMTIQGEPVAIKRGDMILNRTFGEHGLVNNSDMDIDLLVMQINIPDSQNHR